MPRAWLGLHDGIETWLEAERDQLVLWLPVALGGGIAAWFLLPDPRGWMAAMLGCVALASAALAAGRGGRLPHALAVGAIVAAIGLGLTWWRAERVAAPILARPVVAMVAGRVEAVEPLAARDLVRLTIRPDTGAGLPPRIRVNLATADAPKGLRDGAGIRLRARLMPPPAASVPGAYDFARVAWFAGIGATGRGFAPVAVTAPGEATGGLRARLTAHITGRLAGSRGGIAAALATGDEGAISEDDSEAMRRAGLAHLLSVSGLHITAAVAATMLIVMRLLALWPWLAIRVRLPLVAAGAGALAAIGYTLLTGSQVPTIRSCVAALLVLAALVLGREAVTLRLVAAGALAVLLVRPEALTGASFQLSFAAIAAIVALHEHPRVHGWFERRDEGRGAKLLRGLGSLLLTGLVVEAALMPIAVYHFHKAGVYGAAANIVAIPLTTFVVMPLEALALLFDAAGLGAPVWWLTDVALRALLALAHAVAAAPGSSVALPSMPAGAFAAMVGGGLWLALWRTRWRRLGLLPLAVGAIWAWTTPPPDLIVTGDGRHLALRIDGRLAILRERAGDYTRSMLAENGGVEGEPALLDDQVAASCSRDACIARLSAGGRVWRVLATRSTYRLPWAELIAACRAADIVVSERRLPRGCTPRWLTLDAAALRRSGGVAVTLATGTVRTVRRAGDRHPWLVAPIVVPPRDTGGGRGAGRAGIDRHRWSSPSSNQ
ncbi:ComEC family competence protein [Sphingomonas sp. RP10(2022)]|uniref:ComEC family competence protein n=1 Tax=Sphingomonas liriopis TaxID=2949094 RepID=A0A9X2KP92_9SPHN|nr:ComEC/Rec2 family competence protein [Sphingomonas liriopis]MCP3733346.1 ComEC family competence protein [Sphingomonas liriopis]